MISLVDGNNKKIVHIQNWSTLEERPAFRAQVDLNASDAKLKTILGKYHFYGNPVPCGLSTCRQLHERGYLVTTECGIETALGNVCGKKVFGVDFDTMEKQFKRDFNAQTYRENLNSFRLKVDLYEEKVKTYRLGEDSPVKRFALTRDTLNGLSKKMNDTLIRMAHRNDNYFYVERKATEAECEALGKEYNPNTPHYISERAAQVYGVKAVVNYKRIKTIIDQELKEKLITFKELDIELLSYSLLQRWNRWVGGIDNLFHEMDEINEECARFLVESNIQTIKDWELK